MLAAADTHLAPCLTPHGRLVLLAQEDALALGAALAERLRLAFGRGPGHGLRRLGAAEMGQALPPTLGYWRDFAARFVTGLCTQPDASPELLFRLRQVDESELVARAGADLPLSKATNGKKILADGDLSELFGLDIDSTATPARRHAPVMMRKPQVKPKPKAKRVSRRRKRKKH